MKRGKTYLIFLAFTTVAIAATGILENYGILKSDFLWNYFFWAAGISMLEIVTMIFLVSRNEKPSPLIFLAAEMIKMLGLMVVFVVYAMAFEAKSISDAIAFGGLSVYFLATSAFILIKIVREIPTKEK